MSNHSLKKAFAERGITHRFVARKTGIPESYISMAVGGRLNLTKEELKKIGEVLGVNLIKEEKQWNV